jgi:hypothetical protein
MSFMRCYTTAWEFEWDGIGLWQYTGASVKHGFAGNR